MTVTGPKLSQLLVATIPTDGGGNAPRESDGVEEGDAMVRQTGRFARFAFLVLGALEFDPVGEGWVGFVVVGDEAVSLAGFKFQERGVLFIPSGVVVVVFVSCGTFVPDEINFFE